MSGTGGGAETIRSFLIDIGYRETGRKAFTDSMVVVANQAVELGKTMARAAQDVVDAVGHIAESLESLYFQSQRTRATVESINAIGFAASQTGSSVAAARASLEGFGRFLRTTPGSDNFLHGLGVTTRDTNGQLRETGDLLRQTVRVLNHLQPATALAYANMLGIDEKTLLGLTAEADKFDAVSRRMYRAAGVDQEQAARDSHGLMVEFRTLGEAITVLSAKFIALFAPRFMADVRRWREVIEQNFGPIGRALQWIADKVLLVIDVFTELFVSASQVVSGIIGAWERMDPASKRLIGIFAAVVIAWRALSLAFALSPWGAVTLLAGALWALYNDYDVWRDHGKSLIDWSKWKGEIDAASAGIDSLKQPFHELAVEVNKLSVALAKLFGSHEGAGFHNWLTSEIKRTFADLRSIIDGATNLIEILAAVAEGDMPRAWQLIRKMNAGPDPGVTPREGAINSPLNSRGQMPAVADLMDQRRSEEGGDLYHRLFQAPGIGESPTARFFDRARRTWRGERPLDAGGSTPGGAMAGMGAPAAAHDAMPEPQRLQAIHDGFVQQGFSDAQAWGWAANAQQENQGRIGGRPGDGGASVGIIQWNGTRRAEFNRQYGHEPSQGTLAENIAFAAWEARNTERANMGRVNRATTAGEAAGYLSRDVIRPGLTDEVRDAEMRNRARLGERLAARNAGRPLPALPGPSTQPRIDLGELPGLGRPAPTVIGPGGISRPVIAAPQPERQTGDADTTIRVDPDYLRNRNGPTMLPEGQRSRPLDDFEEHLRRQQRGGIPPVSLLDGSPLGAAANSNVTNSTVAPVVNQTTNIHLAGGVDQNRAVIDAQQSVNERLVRNLSTAAR